jgi:hypothetical protein
MRCSVARARLSDWIDGTLDASGAREVGGHVEACPRCERHAEELRSVSRLVAELPRLDAPEPVAGRVFDRLDMETRPPALALLFRGFSAARPFMIPSLVPAAIVVAAVLAAAIALDSGPLPEVHLAPGAWHVTPAFGTEGNPLFPSSEVQLPREASALGLSPETLAGSGEGTVFLETIVARDGSVADVTLLEGGNAAGEDALVEALRQQRYTPARYRGRPVAVSVYRLISRIAVDSSVRVIASPAPSS